MFIYILFTLILDVNYLSHQINCRQSSSSLPIISICAFHSNMRMCGTGMLEITPEDEIREQTLKVQQHGCSSAFTQRHVFVPVLPQCFGIPLTWWSMSRPHVVSCSFPAGWKCSKPEIALEGGASIFSNATRPCTVISARSLHRQSSSLHCLKGQKERGSLNKAFSTNNLWKDLPICFCP